MGFVNVRRDEVTGLEIGVLEVLQTLPRTLQTGSEALDFNLELLLLLESDVALLDSRLDGFLIPPSTKKSLLID